MKIVFNDHGSQAVGSTRIHIYNLHHWFTELGFHPALNNWDNYHNYDVAIFGKNVGIKDISKAKSQNKDILCGSANPSNYTATKRELFKYNDFFIAGSIPEREYYYPYCKHIFLFPQIERIFNKIKTHKDCKPIVLGYHGNLDHLIHFHPFLNEALEILAKEFPIKLIAVYDLKTLGPWTFGRPDIEIEEVQWDTESIQNTLLQCDIGLVPGINAFRLKESKLLFKICKFFKCRGCYDNDYIIRFKNTTNAGRAFVFHQLGIPVISDFMPTSFHILSNPNCGYLAHYTEGWLFALRELCNSAQKRQETANNALHEFNRHYDPLYWSKELYRQIENLLNSPY